MKKFQGLVFSLMVLAGFAIISCQPDSIRTTSNTPEVAPVKESVGSHTGNPNNSCLICDGKGLCKKCKEEADRTKVEREKEPAAQIEEQISLRDKLIGEFDRQTNLALEYLIEKEYSKGLDVLMDLDSKFPDNYLVNYNLTCAYSLYGNKEEAIISLRRAIQLGWMDWKHMDNDADLDNIRKEDLYKKLREAIEIIFPD